MDVNRQAFKMCVQCVDGIDEVVTVVVEGGVICAESVQVVKFYIHIADLVDEGIDCLSNQRPYR